MRYFGFISVDEISSIYQEYIKAQELLKNDARFTIEAQNRANVAFEIWTRIMSGKK